MTFFRSFLDHSHYVKWYLNKNIDKGGPHYSRVCYSWFWLLADWFLYPKIRYLRVFPRLFSYKLQQINYFLAITVLPCYPPFWYSLFFSNEIFVFQKPKNWLKYENLQKKKKNVTSHSYLLPSSFMKLHVILSDILWAFVPHKNCHVLFEYMYHLFAILLRLT